jgi:hypothetical protein
VSVCGRHVLVGSLIAESTHELAANPVIPAFTQRARTHARTHTHTTHTHTHTHTRARAASLIGQKRRISPGFASLPSTSIAPEAEGMQPTIVGMTDCSSAKNQDIGVRECEIECERESGREGGRDSEPQ